MSSYKILLNITGSIACYKACELTSQLIQLGHEVQVVASNNALKFAGEATFEGLTGRRVLTETFKPGQMMAHIDLANWCDLSLIYPATANTINTLAFGGASNLIGSLYLALPQNTPLLIAPAMNTKMLTHHAVVKSLKSLGEQGVFILPTESGTLACGEIGEGKLLSPLITIKHILSFLKPKPLKKILITCGGTIEAIDGVRSITNFSSGNTANLIASEFIKHGHQVTLVKSVTAAITPPLKSKVVEFSNYESLQRVLRSELENTHYDGLIHAAAVSDFKVESLSIDNNTVEPDESVKLSSLNSSMSINLTRNPKLINLLKSYSKNKKLILCGFKLTQNLNNIEAKKKVDDLFKNSPADFVVHNDLNHINGPLHEFTVFNRNLNIVNTGTTKNDLSFSLLDIFNSTALEPNPLNEVNL